MRVNMGTRSKRRVHSVIRLLLAHGSSDAVRVRGLGQAPCGKAAAKSAATKAVGVGKAAGKSLTRGTEAKAGHGERSRLLLLFS